MHTNFRNFFLANIHVGCCLFSHNFKSKTHNKKNLWFDALSIIKYFVVSCIYLHNELIKERSEKKNAEHTCMYTIFRNFFHRNIHVGCCLFSHNNLPTKTKLKSTILPPRFVTKFCFLLTTILFYSTNLIKRAKRKKNAEHTHMYTTFSQLSLHNIHVGCCLFSHNYK